MALKKRQPARKSEVNGENPKEILEINKFGGVLIEAANRAEATALLIRSKYRVYRPEVDYDGEDMVVRTPSGKLIGVQLKSRVIVDDKKYGGRKLWMLFPSAPYHQNKPRDWYLIPHDQLLPRVEQSHGHLATWNKRWSAPVSKDMRAFLSPWRLADRT